MPWIETAEVNSPVLPPTSCRFGRHDAPTVSAAYDWTVFWAGMASRTWRVSTVCWSTLWVSTTGLSPDTVMVSSTAPTRSSAFTVAVNPVVSSTPSRLTVLKPGNVKVTV